MRISDDKMGVSSGFGPQLVERFRVEPLRSYSALVAFLILIGFVLIDTPLAHAMASLQDTWVRPVFLVITDVGKATPYFIVFASALFIGSFIQLTNASERTKARARKVITICVFVLAAMIIAGIALHIFKFVFGRWRPDTMIETGIGGFHWFLTDGDAKSFPSGHSQLIWTVAISLAIIYPRLLILYISIAIVVAASRVAINVHFFSDIVAGSYLGAVVPILLKRHFFDPRSLDISYATHRLRRTVIHPPS